ncbi:MAG: hypothetical protein LBU07_01410 [Coriobacteriales bacterium]|nr:hypothetical protein [Coriobacteriales bacterium]
MTQGYTAGKRLKKRLAALTVDNKTAVGIARTLQREVLVVDFSAQALLDVLRVRAGFG